MTIDFFNNLKSGKIKRNDILIVKDGATTGKVSFVQKDFPFDRASINEHVFRIEIDPRNGFSKYVYLFLKSSEGKKQILNDFRGATVGGISRQFIESTKIPLPSLNDQIRIATVLTRAEKLIAKRKESIKALDELLKSTFLDMFGDPVRNERGWEKKPLSILGSLDRGVSKNRPRNAPELLGGKYPLIQTGEVSNAGTYLSKYSQTYSEIGFKQSKMWKAGTLCITIAANIAKTSILTFDACFPDSVVGFITNKDEANVLYVHHLFGFFQKILEKNAPQAAQKNINLEILRNLQVPKPPLPLQNQFAAIVEKVEVLKVKYTQSLTALENLYGALSQRAFKGELDLSKIPSCETAILTQIQPPVVEPFKRIPRPKFSEQYKGNTPLLPLKIAAHEPRD